MKKPSLLPTLTISLLLSAASAQDVFTSFEFDNATGNFSIGPSPFDATFDNGIAQSIGVPAIYNSGARAWMIDVGQVGEVTFGTPAEQLDFFVRDQFANINGVCKVFDTTGVEVASFNSSSAAFLHVQLQAPINGPFYDKITLTHNGPSGWTVIDDFSYWGVGGSSSGRIIDPIPGSIAPSPLSVHLTPIAVGLEAPNYGAADPLGGDKLYVSDQVGIVWDINLTTGQRHPFHNVQSRLVTLGVGGPGTFDERGLLGIAFHPDYANNGLFYTYTSEPLSGTTDFTTMPAGVLANHHSVVVEWTVPNPQTNGAVVDPSSARELLRIDQPQFNHDGGCIAFGPDDLLYVSLGDGGGADDRDGQLFQGNPIVGHSLAGNGQDACNILGTVLRLDPQGTNAANGSYGIPASNPFVGANPALDEIYAYGFRNPWRFSFDSVTGDLYLGDVGQNDIEEIDLVTAGGNYGWNFKEGSFFFDPDGNDPGFVSINNPGAPNNLIDPIAEYDHDEGISVIGGFVYRGSKLPGLVGLYVFADWSQQFFANNGRLFHLTSTNEVREFAVQNPTDMSPLGFGQDHLGELYVMANSTGTPSGGTGVIYRIDPQPTAACAFTNGSGVNASDYECVTRPALGTTWTTTFGQTANTLLTAMALTSAPSTPVLLPALGGELLLAATPDLAILTSSGDAHVSIPNALALSGEVFHSQGLRLETTGFVLLNGIDLILGN